MLNKALQRDVVHYILEGVKSLLDNHTSTNGIGNVQINNNSKSILITNPYHVHNTPTSSHCTGRRASHGTSRESFLHTSNSLSDLQVNNSESPVTSQISIRNIDRATRRKELWISLISISPLLLCCFVCAIISLSFHYQLWVSLFAIGLLIVSFVIVVTVWYTTVLNIKSRYNATITENCVSYFESMRDTDSIVNSFRDSTLSGADLAFKVSF